MVERTQKGEVKSGVIRYDPSGGRDRAVITGDFSTALFANDRAVKTTAFRAEGG